MSQLRLSISDVEADNLVRGLDKDLSGEVDLAEFQAFLADWKIEVPKWETAALFEALIFSLGKRPAVEDVLLCIALVSRSATREPCGPAWTETARYIGEAIESSGLSLVSFFRKWDADRSGFLVSSELEQALLNGIPGLGMTFTHDQVQALVQHMDSQGVANGRVSLIEFLRAVGPQKLARELSGALLGDVLKPVFFHRSALENIFHRHDPYHSNAISVEEFRSGLNEMNRQLVNDGGVALTESQMKAVCGIASGGEDQVQYMDFLRSLRVTDMVKRAHMAKVATEGFSAFFSNLK
eukprot:TRINITY_DN51102_c0_g1_i1.p1 TRINITY_DN51102_c0_g1~~TRINITY_DN51102_c0_g1_i1.p1  ORF type:complete len:311 (-),score=45.65 TRINITY_DN51102_c0_g1_i1:198-1085(-)